VSNGLFVAATEHGSGHGSMLIVLLAAAVVGGLFYLVRSRRRFDASPRERDVPRNEPTARSLGVTEPIASPSVDRRPSGALAFTQPLPRNRL
jgi:hypothetical protein